MQITYFNCSATNVVTVKKLVTDHCHVKRLSSRLSDHVEQVLRGGVKVRCVKTGPEGYCFNIK